MSPPSVALPPWNSQGATFLLCVQGVLLPRPSSQRLTGARSRFSSVHLSRPKTNSAAPYSPQVKVQMIFFFFLAFHKRICIVKV